MFRKHKSKVLIDYASEEDDMSWSHRRTFKYKDPDGKEEIASSGSKPRQIRQVIRLSKKSCFVEQPYGQLRAYPRKHNHMPRSRVHPGRHATMKQYHTCLCHHCNSCPKGEVHIKRLIRNGYGNRKCQRNTQQIKSKKSKSKREKSRRGVFKDEDERTLLTGAASENAKGSSKRHNDREGKKSYIERGHCLWDSITMSMRQITPAKRVGKMENWEAAHLGEVTAAVVDGNADATLQPDRCSSWTGTEEDSSRYTNLIESKIPSIQWTARAKGRLAVIRRRSRGGVSERWEGLK